MANALKTIRHVYDRIRGQGIRETFIKARDQGFISSLLDGNLFEQKVLKGEGRLVGEDKVGNKVGLPSSNSLHILHEKLSATMIMPYLWRTFVDLFAQGSSSVVYSCSVEAVTRGWPRPVAVSLVFAAVPDCHLFFALGIWGALKTLILLVSGLPHMH
jgi:hypothetical protein